MKTRITAKAVIICIVIILYITALPLTLHFSDAFGPKDAPPDLKVLTGYEPDYINKTNDEKLALLKGIGFDLQTFEDGGFKFELSEVWVYGYDNGQNVSFLRMIVQEQEKNDDEYTYFYITLKVYMPGMESQGMRFTKPYERHEINGKSMGIYEPGGDNLMTGGEARYYDELSGCVYYIEPVLGFNEATTDFLKILVS